MIPKITVQLYSVREDAQKDFAGTIRRIADMGFENVEPAGYPGSSPAEAAALFKELGLSAPSIHGALPVGDDKNRIIEEAQMVGIKAILTGCPPNYPTSFQSVDAIKRCAETFCEAADFAKQYGIQVGIHNHTFEMMDIEGKPAYEYFLEATPEDVLWEADIYWVQTGGRSVTDFIKRIGKRGTFLHFKDGQVVQDGEKLELVDSPNGLVAKERKFLPAGTGDVDLIAAAADLKFTDYIAVELDSYDGDMMSAVAQSYTYLTSNKIAYGRI
jgi:sugar phosphate isomerase/epimerase